jgi:hypothetical protein
VQRSLSIFLLPRTCAPVAAPLAATPRWVQERVFGGREQVGKRRGQENVATLYRTATMGPERRAPVLLPSLFTQVRGRGILRKSRQGPLGGIMVAVEKDGPPSSKSGSERR